MTVSRETILPLFVDVTACLVEYLAPMKGNSEQFVHSELVAFHRWGDNSNIQVTGRMTTFKAICLNWESLLTSGTKSERANAASYLLNSPLIDEFLSDVNR